MKKPLVIMLIIICLMAALIGTGVFAYLYYVKSPTHPHTAHVLSPSQQRSLQVDIPSMTTNLKDDGLIQFTVTLQASDSATKSEITDLEPEIEDMLNRTMRQFSAVDLKEASGYDTLKVKVRNAVNHMLPKGQVTAVFFSQQVVQ